MHCICIRPKKIPVFPLTRPTLFFCADPAIFIAFQKNKNTKIFITTDPKMFQKIGQKAKKKKNVRIAKLMLRIIFFNPVDVLNFIICMFSGTVDDI